MKTVLITGASSGIGKATALQLHKGGWKVYGSSRSIEQDQLPFSVLKMDITKRDSIRRGIDKILAKEGKIDVLINSAGYGIAGAFEETQIDDVRSMFDTNFFGLVAVTQEVLKDMRARKSGTIVNVSSIGGIMGLPFQSFYSASKYAVEGISESMAIELAPWNIKVIVFQPGDVATEFTQNRMVNEENPDSVYNNQFQKAFTQIKMDEKSGISPEKVAQHIEQSLGRKGPKFRYIPSSAEQRMAVILKKIIPFSVFKNVLRRHYNMVSE